MAETARGAQMQAPSLTTGAWILAVAQPPPERTHRAIHSSSRGSTLELHGEAFLEYKLTLLTSVMLICGEMPTNAYSPKKGSNGRLKSMTPPKSNLAHQ